MKILNRLKRMETKKSVNTPFCACGSGSELYLQADESTEPRLLGEPVPDFCGRCNKPTQKSVIIIQGVSGTARPLP
ncbi:MAG TPA: hypothetical protein VK892_06375 [Pyrinomonadaceae bacterium]|nr:hypothetical protein [Pyrinomonadaceae bacterium]